MYLFMCVYRAVLLLMTADSSFILIFLRLRESSVIQSTPSDDIEGVVMWYKQGTNLRNYKLLLLV